MSVTICLHKIYQQYSGNKETVRVEGGTVKECISNMAKEFPELENALFTGKEKLHPLVGIFINSESAYPDPLNRKVKDGDKIYLIHTLAGG